MGMGAPCALLLLSGLGLWDGWAAWHLMDSLSDVLSLEVGCIWFRRCSLQLLSSSGNTELSHAGMKGGHRAAPDMGKESLKMEVGQSWQETPGTSVFLLQREVPGRSCPHSPVAPSMAETTRLLWGLACRQRRQWSTAILLLPCCSLPL